MIGLQWGITESFKTRQFDIVGTFWEHLTTVDLAVAKVGDGLCEDCCVLDLSAVCYRAGIIGN